MQPILIALLSKTRKTDSLRAAKSVMRSFLVWRRESVPCALFRLAPRYTAFALLRGYKCFVSPFLPSACRFYPTCSAYMAEAIAIHGVVRGVWMGIKRLGRCHPFCEGGFDPVQPSLRNHL